MAIDHQASDRRRAPRDRRWLAALAGAAALAMPAPEAAALWDDKLELFVEGRVIHDSNVFRISDQVDPVEVIGSTSRADTYSLTSPGFSLDIPVSRQRFTGGIRWNYWRYNRFTVLDFDGHEGQAAWQWRAGNDWSGQVGYSESLALQSLTNAELAILTGQPNSLETQRAFANANWQMTPRWQLRGDLGRTEQENGLALLTFNDIVIENAGLALLYATPLKNHVGVGLRTEEGSFPNRDAAPPADAFSDEYRQNNVDLILEYGLTGRTRLLARAGRVERSHENLPERDFSEGTYNFNLEWQPGGRTTVNGVARREVSPLDDTLSRFVLLTGFALNPAWRMTDKITTALNLEYSSRDYLSDPSLLQVPSRTDWVRTAGLRFTYQAARALRLDLTLFYETRSSTFPLQDYEVTGANFGVRIGI